MPEALSRRAVIGAGLVAGAAVMAGLGTSTPAAAGGAAADLSLPQTRLARDAIRLIVEAQQPYLRHHSVRSFLFGRTATAPAGICVGADYDVELMFLICTLHDMGLTDRANTDQRFEVDGADFAARFLEDRGVTDHRVDTVRDAIAMHTNRSFRVPAEVRHHSGRSVPRAPAALAPPPHHVDHLRPGQALHHHAGPPAKRPANSTVGDARRRRCGWTRVAR